MASSTEANIESSKSLRALIEHKRKSGQMQAALTLAKLGRRVLMQTTHLFAIDEVSRRAFELYLELTPDDREVKQALDKLPPQIQSSKAIKQPNNLFFRLNILISCLAALGLIAAAIYYFNVYPLATSKSTAIKNSTSTSSHKAASSKVAASFSSSSASLAALASPQPIIIRAVGDVVLGTDYPKSKLPDDEQKKKIIELSQSLNHADVLFGNLEGVLIDKGNSTKDIFTKDISKPGYFSFRMPESYASILKAMGFHVLSVANNHAMDFGEVGLQSTIKVLKEQSIQISGTTSELALVEVRNTKIAFLSYSYLSTVMPMDNETQIKIDINNAKQKADLVFVSVHAGSEGEGAAGTPEKEEFFLNEYRGNIHKFAEFVIDSGASGVFGHGPHVIRPFEIYKDKPIFYSLGNFVGFRTLSTKGKLVQSIVAEVKFSAEGKFLSAGIIPLKMDDFGIPSADYSLTTLSNLDDLLNENLEKRPLLSLKTSSIKTSVTNSSYRNTQTVNSPVTNSENSSTH